MSVDHDPAWNAKLQELENALSDAVLALFAHVQVDSFVGRIAGTDFIFAAGMYEDVRRELAELPREPDEPVQ
jgi:hypothetical protein